MRKETKKEFQLICSHHSNRFPRYIEIIKATEKELKKVVEGLTTKGFNVRIKILKEESLSKEIKKEETPKAKKKVGEKLEKSQVKTKFSGKHKPTLTGGILRKCGVCGRQSKSAWAFTKIGKKMKRKGAEKLTQNDFVCRDITTCKNKK